MPEDTTLPDSFFIPPDEILQGDPPPDAVAEEGAEAPPEQPEAPKPPEPTENWHEARLREITQERNQARAEAIQMREVAIRLHAQQEQRTQPKPPEIDEDVEALIAPIIEKRMAALAPTLEEVQHLKAERESEHAWNVLNQMVPDLQDLQPAIVAHIKGLAPQRAARILADPEALADIAEIVRYRRGATNHSNTEAANRDLRSRGRGEVPGGTRQATPTKDPFADLLNDESKFDDFMRKNGLR